VQGPKRRTDAEALGLGQQAAKLAGRLLSKAAPTMCTNGASIAWGLAQRCLSIQRRGARSLVSSHCVRRRDQ
jgi:hypothetical protein